MARARELTGVLAAAALLSGCPRAAPEGADTLLACGGSFVTPATDAKNCGACGHDCLGGACLGGACQPVILVTGQGPAIFSLYGGLAIDADNLYWTDDTTGVVSMPLEGGAPNQLVSYPGSSFFGGIAVDASRVYWTTVDTGLVLAAPRSGNLVSWTTVASGQATPTGIAVDGASIYWTNDDTNGAVMRAPVGGGTPTPLVSGSDGATGLAIDTGDVYWTADIDGTVSKIAKSGTTPTTLASAQMGANAVAVDASNVYWGTGLGQTVMSAPLGGGPPVTLATEQTTVGSVAVDDRYVYWTLATTSGELRRKPKAGGPVEPLAVACATTDCPQMAIDMTFLVVDDTRVYWTSANLIAVVAK